MRITWRIVLAFVLAVALMWLFAQQSHAQGVHLGPTNAQVKGTLAPANGGLGTGANTGANGKVLMGNGAGAFVEGDPLVQGVVAHDAPAASIAPVLFGCYSSAAAPANVSADIDAVRLWCLLNGSPVVNLASGGSLITQGQKAMANSLPVTIANDQTPVPGFNSTNNSSTATLGIGAVFTGGWDDATNYAAVSVSVFADQASAANGLCFEWSPNASNADVSECSSVVASTGRGFSLSHRGRYFRVKYTNGGTGQGAFRLQSTLHLEGSGLISRAIKTQVNTDNLAQTVKSVTGGLNGANINPVASSTSAPAGTEEGLIVRNIPSGTQPVSGTVTANAGTGQFNVTCTAANCPVNLAQINGVTPLMGNGITGTGSPRVTVASDNSDIPVKISQATPGTTNGVRSDASGATGSAPPARAEFAGNIASGATGGLMQGTTVCDTYVNVTVSTATTTALVTGVSGRHVRICALSLITAGANNVALISGTGATCGTGTTGMNGGTTAATGWNFAANGGIAQGTGLGEINRTNATGDSVCVITSAAVQLSGRIAYAIY